MSDSKFQDILIKSETVLGTDPNTDGKSWAVVACDGHGNGVVLSYGGPIEYEIDAVGTTLSDLGLDDAPWGISIWEGIYSWEKGGYECPEDGNTYPMGTFRKPTILELTKIHNGTISCIEAPTKPEHGGDTE
jgi:hypothetical protein